MQSDRNGFTRVYGIDGLDLMMRIASGHLNPDELADLLALAASESIK